MPDDNNPLIDRRRKPTILKATFERVVGGNMEDGNNQWMATAAVEPAPIADSLPRATLWKKAHVENIALNNILSELETTGASKAEKVGLLKALRNDYRSKHEARLDVVKPDIFSKPAEPTEIDAIREFAEWVRASLAAGGFKIEKAVGSQFDALINAFKHEKIISCFSGLHSKEMHLTDAAVVDALTAPSFVMEHSWARAFEGATDFAQGEWRLPFDDCFFEFQLSGRRIIVMAISSDGALFFRPMFRLKSGWAPLPRLDVAGDGSFQISGVSASIWNKIDTTLRSALERMIAEIRAVSIALEAKVAVSEVVRAPHRLNRARIRDGKLPKNDYHVISLARRSRTAPVPLDDAFGEREKQRRRLHFRRGHWRHFATHKTWINWMLVGDPDLGFIDKHYRL